MVDFFLMHSDTFAERHDRAVEKRPSSSMTRLWTRTAAFSLALLGLTHLYIIVARSLAGRSTFSLFAENTAVAFVALVLMGLSMALSGISYFWDFADTKIVYRKYFGLAGFALLVVHVFVSVYTLGDAFPFFAMLEGMQVSLLTGLGALILFGIMAAISNRYSVTELGGARWRFFLRSFGYTAYALTIVHVAIRSFSDWQKYAGAWSDTLPPLSLLGFLFAVTVMALRGALWVATRKRTQKLAKAVSSRQTSASSL